MALKQQETAKVHLEYLWVVYISSTAQPHLGCDQQKLRTEAELLNVFPSEWSKRLFTFVMWPYVLFSSKLLCRLFSMHCMNIIYKKSVPISLVSVLLLYILVYIFTYVLVVFQCLLQSVIQFYYAKLHCSFSTIFNLV